ncbi:MAG: DUF58 domain-containing protein [Planctomycetota bacterium]
MILGPSEPRPVAIDDLLPPELAKRLAQLDVASRRVFAGRLPGERRSKRRGQSVEFDDYRTYVPGDDLRHIDWNVFARMDRFFLKLFREEEDVTVEVVLDLSPSMDVGVSKPRESARDTGSVTEPGIAAPGGAVPSKRLFAARLAMSLAYVGLVANNRVRLTTFGRGFHQTAAARGRRQVARFAGFLLERLNPDTFQAMPLENEPGSGGGGARNDEDTDPGGVFAQAMNRLARTRSGSGVVFLLSDMLHPGGYERGLTYLAGSRGFEPSVIQILSPSEVDPGLVAETVTGDLRLMDIESGAAAEVSVTPELVAAYRRAFDAYQSQLRRACRARSIGHVELMTDTPLELTLLRRFRQYGLVT